jgi:hypothetical protein
MKKIFTSIFLLQSILIFAQPSLLLKRQRPPELDMSPYKQLVVGDIVGPLGSKTEQSLDLTDALTAKLFNANSLEVIDRNALDVLLGSQKNRDLQVIDEATKQLLNKKLSNAIIISGRIQSQTLQQNLIYVDQSIVVNGCTRTYYYQIKGDVTIQLKVLDLRSGKLIFSNPVIKPVDLKTKEECKVPEKIDLAGVIRSTIADLSEEIAKLVVPYEKKNMLYFKEPGILKSPFRQLKEAVSYLQINNTDPGLAILKKYTESKEIKDKNNDDAWYNYGLGLLYAAKYPEAKNALQMSASISSSNVPAVSSLIAFMDEEDQVTRKMASQALARKAMEEREIEKRESDKLVAETKAPAEKAKAKPKAVVKKK